MDVVINIEPDQEEEMCNKQKPEKKRRCSIWFWLCLFIVPVVLIGGGLTAFFLIPRGADPTPQPPTTTPETPSSTTPQPPEETTIPTTTATTITAMPTTIPTTSKTTIPTTSTPTTAMPTTTTTVGPSQKPQINAGYLGDVPIIINNENHWRVALFSGQVSHSIMLRLCTTAVEKKVSRAVYFNNRQEEESFDKIIHDHTNPSSASVFGNIPPNNHKRLLWTGCYYEKINGVWKLNCGKDTSEYNNFCNQLDWNKDLELLKSSKGNQVIYIVKDYGKENSCWRLYDSKELMSILTDGNNKPATTPFLPFACIYSKNKT